MLKKYGAAIAFLLVLGCLTVANLCYTPPEVSESERRKLKTMPELTAESLVNGKFMSEFEPYALDSFFYRDAFRAVKAHMRLDVYRQKDNNGIYVVDGQFAKLEQVDSAAMVQAAEKFRALSELFEHASFYYAYIPEKGYYIAQEHGYPAIDYAAAAETLREELPQMTEIDLASALSIEDYYQTDLHWNQAHISPVVQALATAMQFEYEAQYEQEVLQGFYGVYAGQSALNPSPEELTLLHSALIDTAQVHYLNANTGEMEAGAVYNRSDFAHVDPYDVFLGGPQPLITLTRAQEATGRELVIFRDSFTSSLAPLLLEGYDKITLVDLRYISARMLPEYLQLDAETDVLFLYGMQVLSDTTVLLN